jgi:PKD repeat protein
LRTPHARAALVFVAALAAARCTDRPDPLGPVDRGAGRGPLTADAVAAAPLVLVGAGDIASCSTNRDQATATLIDALPDATVFTLGDNAYNNGTAAEYTNCYDPSWGRHKGRTRPAPGERDYKGAIAAGYFGYFGTAAGDPTKGYYSYDLGAWHIVVLNSQLSFDVSTPQYDWLVADLAASDKRCTLAYWHAPLFAAGGGRANVRPAWEALYAAGAELVLNAHTRIYERFAPQTPAGVADPYGIREFIVGTGGAGAKTSIGAIPPNSEVRNSGTAGVLKLTLSDGAYRWEFLPVAGETFTDQGSGLCYTGAPPTAVPGGPYLADMSAPSVTFDGTASSDPQGDLPLTYAWDFGDGTTGTGATAAHAYAAPGVYTVTLTVTDAKGNPGAPATTTATITERAPSAPIANAGGPYTADATVTFDGTASSDPDGELPLTYAWNFGDGTTGSGATPGHTYAADGVYTVTLVVTDAGGTASAAATTTATIRNANRPIAQPGGPYLGESTIAFNGSASSDPQGDLPLTYLWTFGDGTTGTGPTPSHTYAADGAYTVSLTVTDAKGRASIPATTTATIQNAVPVVNAGADQSVTLGQPVTVAATFTDAAGDAPWTWQIAWGDGTTDGGTASDPSTPLTRVHTYAAAGAYTVRVTVTDKDGVTGADELVATVTAPATEVVLVGAGDISSCRNDRDELTAQLLDRIPGTVVTLGDNAYPNGRAQDYANCYDPTWGRHKTRTRPALGNHEYDAGTADASFDYFGANAGPRGLGYYSFDLGAWHIVVLNDNPDFVPFNAGSAQDQWLVADLAANTRQCVLAIFHQPRFFSSNTAGFTSRFSRKIFWDRLYAAGAELVLSGHQHHYERFAPMNPDGVRDDANGIRQFVVGTGGESTATPTLEIAANSEVRMGTFGVIKLTLGAGTYRWEFVPMAGETFTDSGTGTCH